MIIYKTYSATYNHTGNVLVTVSNYKTGTRTYYYDAWFRIHCPYLHETGKFLEMEIEALADYVSYVTAGN